MIMLYSNLRAHVQAYSYPVHLDSATILKGWNQFSPGLRGTSYPGFTGPKSRYPERLPPKFSRIEPLNLIESLASVVGRSVTALPFGAFRFGIARLKDWFWSSAHVLFGDAACVVFPLGRLVLQVTTGRRAAGKYSQHQ